MTPAIDIVLEAALNLSEVEREVLVEELLQSLPECPSGLSTDTPGWSEELDRRSHDHANSINMEEFHRMIRKIEGSERDAQELNSVQ